MEGRRKAAAKANRGWANRRCRVVLVSRVQQDLAVRLRLALSRLLWGNLVLTASSLRMRSRRSRGSRLRRRSGFREVVLWCRMRSTRIRRRLRGLSMRAHMAILGVARGTRRCQLLVVVG